MKDEDWSTAITLYEKAVASRKKSKPAAGDAVLRMELARLYCLKEQYKQAAECFAWVSHALDRPAEFSIGDEARKALLLGSPEQREQSSLPSSPPRFPLKLADVNKMPVKGWQNFGHTLTLSSPYPMTDCFLWLPPIYPLNSLFGLQTMF